MRVLKLANNKIQQFVADGRQMPFLTVFNVANNLLKSVNMPFLNSK